jgi:hypothetical protein
MRVMIVGVILLVLGIGWMAMASCCHSDSPDCTCFDNTATWTPSGAWIQDIALDTVGTAVSCVSDGGKPFYQMRMGMDSTTNANTLACILAALEVVHANPYDREAWCSETISYWHREAEIPYSTGYRNSSWHLDWQLTNTNAIRSFYMVEELLDLVIPWYEGRGRWIDWDDLDYSSFNPGVNAPAPGSYVLIRRYNDETGEWEGHSHSMMINEMTIHQNLVGDVVQVEVTILEGNADSPAQVRSSGSIDDLLSYTPAGSEWLSSDRKILGFGIDLDSDGSPIYDADRLHYERDLVAVLAILRKVEVRDPLWERTYAPLIQKLQAYVKKTGGKIEISGPSSVVGKAGIPDGERVSWQFGPSLDRTQKKGVEITIDLLQEHPLPLLGVSLAWSGALPRAFSVQWAGEDGRFRTATVPELEKLDLPREAKTPIPIPVSFGKEGASVRYLKFTFPTGAFSGEALLEELSLLYDWRPGEEAEYNP